MSATAEEIEKAAQSGVTRDEDGTLRVGGVEAEKLAGMLDPDAETHGLSLDDLRLLAAMGSTDGLRPTVEHYRARKAFTPAEREYIDASEHTAIETLAAHGIEVSEYDDVSDLALAVDNVRRERRRSEDDQ